MSTLPTIGERRVEVRARRLLGFVVWLHELREIDHDMSREQGSTWGVWDATPVCAHWSRQRAQRCAAWLELKLPAAPGAVD